MPSVDISTNAGKLAESLRNSPGTLEKYLRAELDYSSKVIAREVKRNIRANGSIAFSTYINSVNSQVQSDGLEAIIFQGTDYGKYVEGGTRGGGYPPQQTIIDWLRVKHIEPSDPDMTEQDLAFLVSRKIALHGTPAKPAFEPSFTSQKDAAVQRINAAIERALSEIH